MPPHVPVTPYRGGARVPWRVTPRCESSLAADEPPLGSDLTLDKGKTPQVTATVKYADGTVANVTTSRELAGTSNGAMKIEATYRGKESASHALIVH